MRERVVSVSGVVDAGTAQAEGYSQVLRGRGRRLLVKIRTRRNTVESGSQRRDSGRAGIRWTARAME